MYLPLAESPQLPSFKRIATLLDPMFEGWTTAARVPKSAIERETQTSSVPCTS
jgi:hypothetical protein